MYGNRDVLGTDLWVGTKDSIVEEYKVEAFSGFVSAVSAPNLAT